MTRHQHRFPLTALQRRDRRRRAVSLAVGALLCSSAGSVTTVLVQGVTR